MSELCASSVHSQATDLGRHKKLEEVTRTRAVGRTASMLRATTGQKEEQKYWPQHINTNACRQVLLEIKDEAGRTNYSFLKKEMDKQQASKKTEESPSFLPSSAQH